MDADRKMTLVQPFYLQLMGLNAADASDEFLNEAAGVGRRTTPHEVVELLRADWRPRAVGAWFALLHDRSAMNAAVLESLRTSAGSLTAPGLAVAAVEIAASDALESLAVYCEQDQRRDMGSCGFVAAAIEHIGSSSTACEAIDRDRDDFASLLAVARRFPAV